jgi:hypothetical protein
MLIDETTFGSLMTPTRVGSQSSGTLSLEVIRASIRRRWEAYKTLREVRAGVLHVTDVHTDVDEVFFDVAPSDTYDAIKLAVDNDLVWSTTNKAVDYDRTIDRWCDVLEHEKVPVARIERMQRNNLDDPAFGDFKITLMEYLISCERKDNSYYRMTGFQAIRQ